jgi:hypothetical protein
MTIRKLITLATLAGFVSLAGAGFAAEQKAPAKDQTPAATTSQAPADKGTPEQPAKKKKKKHTENKS